jgi:hypothetical protein
MPLTPWISINNWDASNSTDRQEQGSGIGMSTATQYHQKGLDVSPSRSDVGTSKDATAGGQQQKGRQKQICCQQQICCQHQNSPAKRS